MNFNLLLENLTNPALLFFALGIVAVLLKSDLEIPPNSSKFISLYLLFAIGFRGGQELSHEVLTQEILWLMLSGIIISLIIPLYTFFILKKIQCAGCRCDCCCLWFCERGHFCNSYCLSGTTTTAFTRIHGCRYGFNGITGDYRGTFTDFIFLCYRIK